jgi:hypothetical protein
VSCSNVAAILPRRRCRLLSLFCPCPHGFTHSPRICRKAKGFSFPNELAKWLWRKDRRKAPDPDCKTSIPGSNPGGASILRSPSASFGWQAKRAEVQAKDVHRSSRSERRWTFSEATRRWALPPLQSYGWQARPCKPKTSEGCPPKRGARRTVGKPRQPQRSAYRRLDVPGKNCVIVTLETRDRQANV